MVKIIIAVDGMGGDNAPAEIVKGCVMAVKEVDAQIIITGLKDKIEYELSKYDYDRNKISVIHAEEIISGNEAPVMALRRKKDSSLVKALNLVKTSEADALVSAGSTGAIMAGASLVIGRLAGIDRIALAPFIPGKNAPFMVIDAGANVDCKPEYLLQFAHMGKVYYENVLEIDNPSVGLINIGVEEAKGNELTKTAYKLLKESNFNFIGNVEPRDIPNGDVNILVCDGFAGNIVLKLYEGVASTIFGMLKEEIMKSVRTKIGAVMLKPVFDVFNKKFDYSEYGGTAFLGAEGICIKAHGSSDGKAFKNAILQAKACIEKDIVRKIECQLKNI